MAESKLIGGLVMLVLFVVACVGWYYAIYPTKKACGKEGAESFVNRTRHARLNNRVKNLERFVTTGPVPKSPNQYDLASNADVEGIACKAVKNAVKNKPTYAYCSAGAVGGLSGRRSYAGPGCKPAQNVCGKAKFRDLTVRRHRQANSGQDLDMDATTIESFKRRRIPKERFAHHVDSLSNGYGM